MSDDDDDYMSAAFLDVKAPAPGVAMLAKQRRRFEIEAR